MQLYLNLPSGCALFRSCFSFSDFVVLYVFLSFVLHLRISIGRCLFAYSLQSSWDHMSTKRIAVHTFLRVANANNDPGIERQGQNYLNLHIKGIQLKEYCIETMVHQPH